ncbi:hypothetical protein [Isoptericola sp. NPDC057559]|uniref:hypothetical protein n=1 Tax=Isoptericola sp. NPDC057559 TaxID=3346168 RepID=UPI0036D0BAA5
MFTREHDPSLDVFDGGCLVLRRDGEVAGHVATMLGTFWSPGRPLTVQQQVWLVVVWADGERERVEDYPPWSVVASIRAGEYVEDDGPHRGRYTVTWLPEVESEAMRAELGVTPADF